MKKIVLWLGIFFGLSSIASSQELSYGLTGGVNYTMGGEITGDPEGGTYWGETAESESNVGFHGGAFLQVNFGNIFIRPEAIYTSLESRFEFPSKTSVYSIEKIDLPLLVGYNIWGPLDLYAGPVYSNILDSSLTGNQLSTGPGAQNTNIHIQAGTKLEFGRFGVDLRYEYSLSSEKPQELKFINSEYGVNKANFNDAYLDQIILSVIFKFGGPGLDYRRKRTCY